MDEFHSLADVAKENQLDVEQLLGKIHKLLSISDKNEKEIVPWKNRKK